MEQGMYEEYKWAEVVVIMDVKMKLTRENRAISMATRAVEDQLIVIISKKGDQIFALVLHIDALIFPFLVNKLEVIQPLQLVDTVSCRFNHTFRPILQQVI